MIVETLELTQERVTTTHLGERERQRQRQREKERNENLEQDKESVSLVYIKKDLRNVSCGF